MSKIPIRKITEVSEGEIAFVKCIYGDSYIPPVKHTHKDDYYIFFLMLKGTCKVLIDFEENEVTEQTISWILPGQVHLFKSCSNVCGWLLAVDSMFVKDEYKTVVERATLSKKNIQLSDNIINELAQYILAIKKRLKPKRQYIEDILIHDLISCYVGMIAEVLQNESLISKHSRLSTIAFEFKSLLTTNYSSLKRTSEYASVMNLSPSYLNEAVKKITGFSVTECVQNEIAIQAKRLLYHTNMSIKEIALKLGYEDWAYFTRLFTKISNLTPTEFRKKYRN